MNKEPLINIIVPVYNTEKYIRKCLDSIVNQTYRNLEIIVVDEALIAVGIFVMNMHTKMLVLR